LEARHKKDIFLPALLTLNSSLDSEEESECETDGVNDWDGNENENSQTRSPIVRLPVPSEVATVAGSSLAPSRLQSFREIMAIRSPAERIKALSETRDRWAARSS